MYVVKTKSAFGFYKSRGTATGSFTAVLSGDSLGQLYFYGADGTQDVIAATITAAILTGKRALGAIRRTTTCAEKLVKLASRASARATRRRRRRPRRQCRTGRRPRRPRRPRPRRSTHLPPLAHTCAPASGTTAGATTS